MDVSVPLADPLAELDIVGLCVDVEDAVSVAVCDGDAPKLSVLVMLPVDELVNEVEMLAVAVDE